MEEARLREVEYLSRDTINVQLHHVLPTGVILWLSLPVLWVDDATYKHKYTFLYNCGNLPLNPIRLVIIN